MNGLIVDLFAGGGGASVGIEAALGRPVDVAINHDAVALAVHLANHPQTKHLTADIWEVRPLEATGGRPVELLWASPDCTHFSVAKGGKPRKQNIRSLAWAVVRWASAVRPRIIALENVAEFRGWGPLGKDGRPDKARMGETFKRWRRKLEALGYVVDYRVLDASHYGAPTRRRRLFLVARRDGQPIRWPEPTHGPGRVPFRTAAECIDWTLPCPSIFERSRPLAEKTMWRIAQGIKRFVMENPRPFVVKMKGEAHSSDIEAPAPTITAQGPGLAVAVPSLVQMSHGEGDGATKRRGRPAHPLTEPLPTQSASNDFGLLAPTLIKFRGDSTGAPVDTPAPTITAGGQQRPERPATGNPIGLLAPTLIQTGYGERKGQAARVLDLQAPLGTCVDGQKHGLVSAWLAKHYGGQVGQPAEAPASTITATDHHGLAAVTLATFRGTDPSQPGSASVEEPLPVVSAGGVHVAEVRAFLTAYYGSDGTEGQGQQLIEPMRTLTTRHRLGLVVIEGTEYQIVDIGMRMLQPHELKAAQFGRFAAAYDLGAARTKSAQVRLIGNSVCPEVAEALVRANTLPRSEGLMRYAGAEWLARYLRRGLLPFEAVVADILGATWRGLYHLDHAGLRNAKWSKDHVSLCVWGELATYDGSELTTLAILCADAHVRLAVSPAMRYLRLSFTPRMREGEGSYDSHPGIYSAINHVRANVADLRDESERGGA